MSIMCIGYERESSLPPKKDLFQPVSKELQKELSEEKKSFLNAVAEPSSFEQSFLVRNDFDHIEGTERVMSQINHIVEEFFYKLRSHEYVKYDYDKFINEVRYVIFSELREWNRKINIKEDEKEDF